MILRCKGFVPLYGARMMLGGCRRPCCCLPACHLCWTGVGGRAKEDGDFFAAPPGAGGACHVRQYLSILPTSLARGLGRPFTPTPVV